ncbi:NlpC/P60 family putative phage cell wall peptidase [Litoreibacter meonggei]|uniref:NlpC/P60 family putative phage cell wall peptidase n=1 Tax=Litoreibacter meonggei TaxID=1049199 RepID=A0A497X256_9RHOB|nr:NlpC/P60 family protein [Litoreibacter meonggei]RLJ60012.1 NlpC/P60 family putative phage cell wall peptidase [Litoreibacter meonggei]
MSGISEQIVAEAREWIGTPYLHQASCKGAGADCLGLLRGVWRAVYGTEPEAVPAYSADWSEPQGEERLWAAARRRLVAKALDEAALGDVVLFRMREQGVAKHLGITSTLGDAPKFIHAYSGHGVVESPFSEPWARRVVARFEFPKAGS